MVTWMRENKPKILVGKKMKDKIIVTIIIVTINK